MPKKEKKTALTNIFILISSNLLAQGVTFALSPVIGRLYEANEFGSFGAFQNLSTILLAINMFQYYQAIMLPKRTTVAYNIVALNIYLVFFVSVLFLLFQFCFPLTYLHFVGIEPTPFHVLGFFIYNVSSSAILITTTISIRYREYKKSAKYQALKTLITAFAQLLFGLLLPIKDGLIIGSVVGSLSACLIAIVEWKSVLIRALKLSSANILIKVAKEYFDFALYSTPQTFINSLGQSLPVFSLQSSRNFSISGQFSFARKIMNVPLTLISSATKQVVFKEIAEAGNRRQMLAPIIIRYSIIAIAISIIPAMLGFFILPWIFPLVFGAKWKLAGQISAWLLLWMFPGVVNTASIVSARVTKKQGFLLCYEIMMFMARYAAVLFIENAEKMILWFCIIGGAGNMMLIMISIAQAKKHDMKMKNQ